MADEEKPKSNIKRPRKADKYLPDEKVGEYQKFIRDRESGTRDFGSAGEEAIKNVKPEAIKNALMKKMFLAMSDSKEQTDKSPQDVNLVSIDRNLIRLLSKLSNFKNKPDKVDDTSDSEEQTNKSDRREDVSNVSVDDFSQFDRYLDERRGSFAKVYTGLGQGTSSYGGANCQYSIQMAVSANALMNSTSMMATSAATSGMAIRMF